MRGDPRALVEAFDRRYASRTALPRLAGHRYYEVEQEEPEVDWSQVGIGLGGVSGPETEAAGEAASAAAGSRPVEDATEEPAASTFGAWDEPSPDGDLSYHQIGVRTSFPVEVLESWGPGFVAREVVDGIEETEKQFVADALARAPARDGGPGGTAVEELCASVEDLVALAQDRGVRHLLVPDGVVERLRRQGELRERADGTLVVPGVDGDVEVHVYDGGPTDTPGGTRGERPPVLGLRPGAVEVVQKLGQHAEPPPDVFQDAVKLNYDRALMVYFGDDTYEGGGEFDELVDLIYRVVVSEPRVVGPVLRVHLE